MPNQKPLIKGSRRKCICCVREFKRSESGAVTLFQQLYVSKSGFGNFTMESIVICESCGALALAGYKQQEGRQLCEVFLERLRSVFNHVISARNEQAEPPKQDSENQCQLGI